MEKSDLDAISIINHAIGQIEAVGDQRFLTTQEVVAATHLARAIRYLRNGHVLHTKARTYRSNRREQ